MKTSCLVLAVLLGLVHSKNLTEKKRVQVQVYYESLCHDSISFITKELYPAFFSLTDRIKLELIPWGRASEETVNGTKTFTCQHGVKECYGNKVHACVIDLFTMEESTEFVFCSERSDDPTDDVYLKLCTEEANVSWTDIQECLSSGKADELLSANGKKTALVNPKFIPTIILDGKFSQENQDKSLLYFRELICELLGWPKHCDCLNDY